MRAALMLFLLLASALCIGGQSESVSESNSYSAGANITNQNVFNNSDHMVLGDVECPKPVIGVVGGTSAISGSGRPEQYHVGIGLSIPLLTNDCDEAVKLQLRVLKWSALDREFKLKKEREQHEVKMANSCAQIPRDHRPKICNRYRSTSILDFHK